MPAAHVAAIGGLEQKADDAVASRLMRLNEKETLVIAQGKARILDRKWNTKQALVLFGSALNVARLNDAAHKALGHSLRGWHLAGPVFTAPKPARRRRWRVDGADDA